MSEIITPVIEEYLASLATPREPVLLEMEGLAREQDIPIVGPLVGAFLYQLASIKGAKRVFELGSAIGYSTLWLALAVGEDGEVFYTDSDEHRAEAARAYFERAGVADRIQIKVGDALEMFEATGGDFDLIFNDVDKAGYPKVLTKALPRLRRGGVLITDNVLWSGRVVRPLEPGDDATRGILEFNRLASEAEGCVYSILPLRDGVGVLLKS